MNPSRIFIMRPVATVFSEAGVVTQRRIEDKVLVEFCNTHRHVAIVPQGEGERKFKDV